MTLPDGFTFSQANLQDYIECQRRFQLRHLLHLEWPAVEVEPYQEHERLLVQGMQFHKIVRQHLLGISETQIEGSIGDDVQMHLYWNSYKQSLMNGVLSEIFTDNVRHYEEIILSVPMNGFRLTAKYDVIVVKPDGNCVIVDWKTSHRQPKRKWLADRMQTHIYPFVLSHGAAGITDNIPLDPEKIEMVYWFANQPEQPICFEYEKQAFEADKRYLGDLITAISAKTELVFPLTPDYQRCLFCTYRSFCERGVLPGDIDELDTLQELEFSAQNITLDYEQIGEIEF